MPVAASTDTTYLIFETRNEGSSVLTRTPITGLN
jgi:hypothetical protein